MSKIVSSPLLALAAPLLSAASASAHAHFTTAVPAADSVSALPAALTFGFSEGIELRFSGVTLKDAEGHAVATGVPSPVSGDDRQVAVRPSAALAPGTYEVDWQVLAKDGHATDGTYWFTVEP